MTSFDKDLEMNDYSNTVSIQDQIMARRDSEGDDINYYGHNVNLAHTE